MQSSPLFKAAAYFVVGAVLILQISHFSPFWQLLWETTLQTTAWLLSLPTPAAFNYMLITMVGTVVLGWPLAVLVGALKGLQARFAL